MNRLTYLKGERSKARKELKNYLIIFRDEISEECKIKFPSQDEMRNMTSEEFDNWFSTICSKIKKCCCEDIILIEHIEYYICSLNNVASAEETNKNNIYF